MAEEIQFKIRLPAELKARLEQVALNEGKSLTAVIVRRLEDSFPLLESELLAQQQEHLANVAMEISRLRNREEEVHYDLTILRTELGAEKLQEDPRGALLLGDLGEIGERLDMLESLQSTLTVVVDSLRDAVRSTIENARPSAKKASSAR